MAGIILCFTSWIFSGIGFVIYGFYTNNTLLLFFYGLAYITAVSGYTSFKANIVQYNIDQLVGASADELSAVIYWHSAAVPISFVIFQLIRCAIIGNYIFLITFVSAGLSLSVVLVSHSLFKHKLENVSLIKNPVKLIVRVLCYARKHKYPENRSALTYWEEETPSRLDLGKHKYGGPFTEEEVEDVKTVFRMLPLLISVVGLTTNDEVYHWIMSGNQSIEISYGSCLISTEFGKFFTSVVFFLFYLLIFQPIFKRFIPRMLLRIGVGLVFAVCTMFSKTVIFFLVPPDASSVTPFTTPLLYIPQFFYGVAFVLIIAASLEFTVAQAPVQMRGMMVGMWLASMGVGYLININLKYGFQCTNEFMCTNPFYYAVKSVITLVFFSLFFCLSKRYKFRVRGNEINIHKIVEDHYHRYMTQKDAYEAAPSDTVIIEEETPLIF
uniref:Major facilitator superfamily associated domain-containing protein n=1 Tax=Amphimedon queenslandica TaxID=400682 RepID=A0A1X7U3J2_AMPQE